jgi:uncharacterized protein (DUF983 family)
MPDAAGVIRGAILGLCPRCGARTLFATMLAFAPVCSVCGLDYHSFNVGDGAAALVTLLIGAIVVSGSIAVQLMFDPPVWLQLLIWIPVTTIGVIGLLRATKAALLTFEYRTGAREGRIE